MKKLNPILAAGVVTAVGLALMAPAGAAQPTPGSSASDPIVVASPGDVPEGAVQTGQTKDECETTTTWSLTTPGSDETSHQEWGAEERTRTATEVPHSHEEYKYSKTVEDTKTQYHFAKYTQTRTRAKIQGTPAGPNTWYNWSPRYTDGPQNYTPSWPSDSRGTWIRHDNNGGPKQGTFGTFQTGGGNSPFFHREHGTPAVSGRLRPLVRVRRLDQVVAGHPRVVGGQRRAPRLAAVPRLRYLLRRHPVGARLAGTLRRPDPPGLSRAAHRPVQQR